MGSLDLQVQVSGVSVVLCHALYTLDCLHSLSWVLSLLSSLDFTIVVFLAESNGCIKQTLFKPLPNIVVQRKYRGCATKQIWLTHLSIITKISCSSCCMNIFDSVDFVTFSEDAYNKFIMNQTS